MGEDTLDEARKQILLKVVTELKKAKDLARIEAAFPASGGDHSRKPALLDREYVNILTDYYRASAGFNLAIATMRLNARCKQISLNGSDSPDYELKKKVQKAVGEELRYHNLTILHPITSQPCHLYVVATPDKKGNYILEDRQTKKRSNSSKSLLDMLPFKLEFLDEDISYLDSLSPEDWAIHLKNPIKEGLIGRDQSIQEIQVEDFDIDDFLKSIKFDWEMTEQDRAKRFLDHLQSLDHPKEDGDPES